MHDYLHFELKYIIQLLMAFICGIIVGVERQLKGKPVGIRTSILICIGTSVFVSLGQQGSGGNIDSSRVLGQIVTGVGFLGAGVMMNKDGKFIGVTSAAVIWILAAAGACIGYQEYLRALLLSFSTVAILVGVERLEKFSARFTRGIYQYMQRDLTKINRDE